MQSNITFLLSALVQATANNIHEPLTIIPMVKAAITVNGDVFPYALIIIACVIFILGAGGIVYICVSWSKYNNFKQRLQRHYAAPLSPSRYDSVIAGSTVDASLKEYETQVLNMTVPQDDNDSYNDLQIDFSSKNHAFNLDNVSYITKDIGQQSPVGSDTLTTVRASSVVSNMDGTANNITNNLNTFSGNNLNTFQRNNVDLQSNLNRNNLILEQNNSSNRHTLLRNKNTENMNTLNRNMNRNQGGYDSHQHVPIINPLYQSPEEDTTNISPSNDNITFGKKDYSHMGYCYINDRSPVETTTEL